MQNFVVGDIVTAPSPASSGTSVTVNNGSYFPDPSTFGDYNLVMWDRLGGETPSLTNCEIVRVTAKTTDNDNAILTITRAQESTSAKELGVNWRVYMSPTQKYFDDLDSQKLPYSGAVSDLDMGTKSIKAKDLEGRLKPRTQTVASETTHTIDTDSYDEYIITAQAADCTMAAPTGTLVSGQSLIIRIKDNGTIRAITWNAAFRASSDLALPTATKANKTMYLGFKRNTTDSKWDLLAYLDNI